ncbi:hypothetical protein DAMA08_003100 [Martiniozyma asiatica (nom. inval.)]|nr:hypothetical protein DAMA08_003100 [Martiniozyma asiatica]
MFSTVEEKYQALIDRSPEAEGLFVYAVISTGIVCRPTCISRIPLEKNVTFYKTFEEGANAGFRACKRCKPDISDNWNTQRILVLKMVEYISDVVLTNVNSTPKNIRLDDMAKKFNISKWHMLRTFKRYTGKTPLQFYKSFKSNKLLINIPIVETKRNMLKKEINKQLEILQNITLPTMSSQALNENHNNTNTNTTNIVDNNNNVNIVESFSDVHWGFSIDGWEVDKLLDDIDFSFLDDLNLQ